MCLSVEASGTSLLFITSSETLQIYQNIKSGTENSKKFRLKLRDPGSNTSFGREKEVMTAKRNTMKKRRKYL